MNEETNHESCKKVIPDIGIIDPQDRTKKVVSSKPIAPTLRSETHRNEPKVCIPVLTPDRANKRQNGRRFKENGEAGFTLTGQDKHGVAIEVNSLINNNDIEESSDIEERPDSITVNYNGTVIYAVWYEKYQCHIAIRKLTPKECFRLQGWTDDYFEKAEFVNSDSQLYKQAGNGITVSVVEAIAQKLSPNPITFVDLFAGVGGLRRGMELAGHKCIGFCEYDKYARASYISMHCINETQRSYLQTLNLNQRQKEILKDEYLNGEWSATDIREVAGDSIPKVDCWGFGAPCFIAGTLITTSEGLKPIEDVQVGDTVLTHTNEWHKVEETMNHLTESLYELKVMGAPLTKVTGNHRFWIRYEDTNKVGVFTEPEWKAVEDFNGEEYCLFSQESLWRPIHSLNKIECEPTYVYNLEVEKDHSYVANGIAVHNCQDFSVAGKRRGLDGDRSSLIREVFRILEEIKEEDRPEWLIYENVKGMFSSNRGFDYFSILCAMDELGYDVEWQLLNSKNFGVPQNRERVYTIGHLRSRGESKVFPIGISDEEDSVRQIEETKINIIGHRENYRRNTQVFAPDGVTEALDTGQGGGRGHHTAIPVNANLKDGIRERERERNSDSEYADGERLQRSGEPRYDCSFGIDFNRGGQPRPLANTIKARYDAGVTNFKQDGTAVALPIDIKGMMDEDVFPTDNQRFRTEKEK